MHIYAYYHCGYLTLNSCMQGNQTNWNLFWPLLQYAVAPAHRFVLFFFRFGLVSFDLIFLFFLFKLLYKINGAVELFSLLICHIELITKNVEILCSGCYLPFIIYFFSFIEFSCLSSKKSFFSACSSYPEKKDKLSFMYHIKIEIRAAFHIL